MQAPSVKNTLEKVQTWLGAIKHTGLGVSAHADNAHLKYAKADDNFIINLLDVFGTGCF